MIIVTEYIIMTICLTMINILIRIVCNRKKYIAIYKRLVNNRDKLESSLKSLKEHNSINNDIDDIDDIDDIIDNVHEDVGDFFETFNDLCNNIKLN